VYSVRAPAWPGPGPTPPGYLPLAVARKLPLGARAPGDRAAQHRLQRAPLHQPACAHVCVLCVYGGYV
jgi:hypothetical protein